MTCLGSWSFKMPGIRSKRTTSSCLYTRGSQFDYNLNLCVLQNKQNDVTFKSDWLKKNYNLNLSQSQLYIILWKKVFFFTEIGLFFTRHNTGHFKEKQWNVHELKKTNVNNWHCWQFAVSVVGLPKQTITPFDKANGVILERTSLPFPT